jgi:hypothetical protein
MATQLEAFRLVVPEFAAESDATVQAFLDLAPHFIDPMQYDESVRSLALVYQAASLMYQKNQSALGNSSGGQLASEKEGDLARSYFKGGGVGVKGASSDIYAQQLDTLSLAVGGIMTRYGSTIPQGVIIG